MSRKSYSTRWDEENCAPQCYGCNVMQQGQQFLFSKYIDEKYGEGYSQVLLIKSKQKLIKTNQFLFRFKAINGVPATNKYCCTGP